MASKPKVIRVLTTNKSKRLAAKLAFSKYGFKVTFINPPHPEIQADTSLEIARHTALQVAKEIGFPVVREDHSLYIGNTKMFGPYVNYFSRKLRIKELLGIIDAVCPSRKGYFELSAVYAEPNGRTIESSYKQQIRFIRTPRGKLSKYAEDSITVLPGKTKTFAEEPEETRSHVWSKNFNKIARQLSQE